MVVPGAVVVEIVVVLVVGDDTEAGEVDIVLDDVPEAVPLVVEVGVEVEVEVE